MYWKTTTNSKKILYIAGYKIHIHKSTELMCLKKKMNEKKGIACSCIGRLNIIKMLILSKLSYKSDTVINKIQGIF